MLTVPLTEILEQAQAAEGEKHLAGSVRAPGELFTTEALDRLAAWHQGAFAFLAFNAAGDPAVAEYIESGTLADDSGARTMCLYSEAASVATGGTPPPDIGLALEVDSGRTPASLILEALFSPEPSPPLPGIAFFADFFDDTPVYVPLTDCDDPGAVRTRLRELFALAAEKADYRDDGSFDRKRFSSVFATALQRRRVSYRVAGRRSLREWLVRAYQTAWDHRQDLVTAVGLVGL